MSFICDGCKKVVAPGIGGNKVVTETREKVYVTKYKDRHGFVRETRNKGTEIVKEQNLCPTCYSRKGTK